MKPLSKNAMKALEVLKAGGFFITNPTYGRRVTLHWAADEDPVEDFGQRTGRAKAVRHELIAAGVLIDEEMDGRNLIIGKLVAGPEATS